MECRHKYTMCRLCLCGSECFVDIFQVNEWFGYIAAEVMRDLLQLQVSETDGYPQVVCSICLGKLTDFKQFKEQCQDSRDTYNNMLASYESHDEHPADIEPLASIKSEPEESTNEVDITTEVELRPVKLEPEDPLDTQETQKEVRKCSIPVTSLGYLEGHQKRTQSRSYGPHANVKVGKMDVKVGSDCKSPGEKIDMLPDINRVESSVTELRRGTMKTREEAIRVDTSVDAILRDGGTAKLKIGSEYETTGGSGRERGEEAPLGVEEREVYRERFSCRDCGKDFQKKDMLIRHLELHGYVINEESCGEERDLQVGTDVTSGTKCKTSDSLKTGLKGKTSNKVKTDKGVRKYVCDSCGKGFNWIGHMGEHSRSHNGERPYVCGICGKGFISASGLKAHKFNHTGEKPHMCQVCGKQFAQRRILKNHERIHSGEKPYVCEVCSKPFLHCSSLTYHRRIHSGEKPYMCEFCGKNFSSKQGLKHHGRVYHGVKP